MTLLNRNLVDVSGDSPMDYSNYNNVNIVNVNVNVNVNENETENLLNNFLLNENENENDNLFDDYETILFYLDRPNTTFYIIANFEKKTKPDTLSQLQFEKLESFNDIYVCPICMEEQQDNIILTCKHVFCKPCIEKWLLKKSNTCPTCRIQVK
jgi:hypothetical protein